MTGTLGWDSGAIWHLRCFSQRARRRWSNREKEEVQRRTAMRKLMKKESGQSLVEYALIIALVSIALVVGLTALAGGISGTFASIIASM
jgi:pilus assembly protein Flp/PilA